MRVLFDHQIFSYQAFGGASRYYAELMSSFARERAPAFDLGVAESPNAYLASSTFYRGKVVKKTTTAAFLRTYARNELTTYRAARRSRHDILHATFYDPGVLRSVRGAKLVVTVLDMIPERFPEMFPANGLYGRFVTGRWIAGKRTLCERADAIIAISEHTKSDVVRFFGIAPERITVTHLGNRLAGDTTAPRPAAMPARYVLFVGMRGLYKNFAVLVEALSRLPEIALACIGGGAFTDEERALLARFGMAGRTAQHSVPDEELAAWYAHAAAFVFPSRYEGFGIPIVEAFACGCPTILANASCFPEVAGDAALYFDPDSADELRTALQQVLAQPALCAQLREKGHIRARELTWERTAERTRAVYEAVAA